jgi:hypothetical protein
VEGENKEKAIQFPFAKSADGLEQTARSRLAHLAGNDFLKAIISLKPHAGGDGNTLLVLLHEINIVDKHKFPTPAGNFSKIDSKKVQAHVPDFPGGLHNCGVGRSKKDVVWNLYKYESKDVERILPPHMHVYHRELDLPVQTWFYIDNPLYHGEVIDTLVKLKREVSHCLVVMSEALGKSA